MKKKLFISFLVLLGMVLAQTALAQTDSGSSVVVNSAKDPGLSFYDGQTFYAQIIDLKDGFWALVLSPFVEEESRPAKMVDTSRTVVIPIATGTEGASATNTTGTQDEGDWSKTDSGVNIPVDDVAEEPVLDNAAKTDVVYPVDNEPATDTVQDSGENATLVIQSIPEEAEVTVEEPNETPVSQVSAQTVAEPKAEVPKVEAVEAVAVQETVQTAVEQNLTARTEPELPPYHAKPKPVIESNSPVKIVENSQGKKVAMIGSVGRSPSQQKTAVIGSIGNGGQVSQETMNRANTLAASVGAF